MCCRDSEGDADRVAGLYLWPGASLLVAPMGDTSSHAHHAVQVCLAVEEPFRIQRHGAWQVRRFVVVPADEPHRLDGQGQWQMLVLLDREGQLARDAHRLLEPAGPRPAWPWDLASAHSIVRWLLGSVASRQPEPVDVRIERVLAHIARPGARRFRAANLARIAGMSESRMRHVFSQSMGLPLRRYVLWRRVLDAVERIAAGESFTDAAHAGGFSDSAHFSRVFRTHFGLAPREVLKNSQFVQVHAARFP